MIDLHMHSRYSDDGEFTPTELIEQCAEKGIGMASLDRLAETQALGFGRITEKDMWEISKDGYWQGNWTGEMFAEVLLAMPEYADHPLLKPYRPGGERSDNPYVNFYWDYYSQGKPCYAEIVYPSMKQIVDMIHQNHGVAVIAHPGVNLKGKEFLLEGILNLGIDGIEAFSSYHSPEQAEYYFRTAKERKLFATCGSDYHGKTKPSIGLGQHNCPVSYTEKAKQLEKYVH